MITQIPNKKAWKVNDEAWMASRKREWLDVEYNISQRFEYPKEEYPFYKEYFLTGDQVSFNNFYRLDNKLSWLVAFWLHAGDSLTIGRLLINQNENLQALSRFFTSYGFKHDFKGKSPYNGKDISLFQLVFPDTFNRDNYANLSDQEYKDLAYGYHMSFMRLYRDFLTREPVNQFDYCQVTINFWKSLVKIGYEDPGGLKKLLCAMQSVIEKGDSAHELHLQMVGEIEAVFDSEATPKEMKQAISDIRSQF
ncbi:MAG: hypothetical protein HWE27_16275 [Gammaproteobacteria bacterium]|nr:hypothetical protein [Gammaproteobacteria bacterium]